MEQKQRCQSCGMPLGEGFFGTDVQGVQMDEYCKFCYEKGCFTDPHLTVEGMIDKSVNHMQSELHMSEEQARTLAQNVIPALKRWKK